MRSALYTPAPSSTLLKFLKSQSESVCFFTPNSGQSLPLQRIAQQATLRPCTANSSKTCRKSLSTTIPRCANVEAGLVNLDFLWPGANTSALQHRAQGRPTIYNRQLHTRRAIQGRRNASTGFKRWAQRIWGMNRSKGGRGLRPDDLPRGRGDSSETAVFSLGRAVSAKAAAQPKLRCTELDENGNVTLASGEFKKSELIAKVRNSLLNCCLKNLLIYFPNSMDFFLAILEKSILVSYRIFSFDPLRFSSTSSICGF